MKLIEIDGAFINPDAIDMIYYDEEANMFVKYGKKQASILLRSGQRVYVDRSLDEVKKMFTEAKMLPY